MDTVEDIEETEQLAESEELELKEDLNEDEKKEPDTVDEDETAEDLMTDMKLEDETDDVRASEPDFEWAYFIEVYPWNADDLSENFVKLIRLAQFSRIVMKKKKAAKEPKDSQNTNDRVATRQRKGYLQMYMDDRQTAKNVMRSMTWKKMVAKELTVEITRRDLEKGTTETAYMEVNTYPLCKIRFREKPKGELKDRSAKVSNLPGEVTREFMEVVLNRAYPVIGGTIEKANSDENASQSLQDIEGFDGSLDFDCLTRGSCRSFVQGHKKVTLNGKVLSFEANNEETMVVPPFTHDIGVKKKEENEKSKSGDKPAGQHNNRGKNSSRGGSSAPNKMRGLMGSGPRDHGRGLLPLMRPVSAPMSRPSLGMPVPMTGRQKMNEKLRRGNLGMNSMSGGGGLLNFPTPGINLGMRGSLGMGDSFKDEISSLQTQLQRSTDLLEAKIAMLQAGGYYDTEMRGFDKGGLGDGYGDYDDDYDRPNYSQNRAFGGRMQQQKFSPDPPALMQTGISPRRMTRDGSLLGSQSSSRSGRGAQGSGGRTFRRGNNSQRW